MWDIIKKILIIKKQVKMKNWKTTIGGILALIPTILSTIGLPMAPELANAIQTIAVALIAYFAKDKDVTGGTTDQTKK